MRLLRGGEAERESGKNVDRRARTRPGRTFSFLFKKFFFLGTWVAQFVKNLPSVLVLILESWNRALYQGP